MTPLLGPEGLIVYMNARGIEGEVMVLDTPTPTVQAAALAVDAAVDQIVKTVIFLVEDEPVATITCGVARVSRRPVADRFGVGQKRVKLASPSQVLEFTGYEAGAVPPFGHIHPIRTLLDPRVLEQKTVYAGGGAENALLKISPQAILEETGADVLDIAEAQETP